MAAQIGGALRTELVRALAAADRANNAVLQEGEGGRWTVQGDPTEGALIVAARKAGLEDEALDARFARVAEVPFSSERKLMSTVHSDAERQERLLAFTKGAPDVLLGRCTHELVGEEARPLTADRRAAILRSNEELAGEALRTLGVAFRSLPKDGTDQDDLDEDVEHDLVFLGLIGMIDPPREEAKEAVARARGAGIRPMMITGDHPRTAAAIAAELGIAADGRAVTGAEIERMPDEALDRTVAEVSVYARVNPEHKLRIVKALQRGGATVAMTGDGVNDAPALKTADIGVAMGITGTDVSKEAADMVLADDNFATIVAAVEEGRGDLLEHQEVPALPAVVEHRRGDDDVLRRAAGGRDRLDGAGRRGRGAAAAGDADPVDQPGDGRRARPRARRRSGGPGDDGEPPRPRGEGVITRRMWAGIFFVGAVMAAGTLLVLDASLPGGLIEGSGDLRYAQTMAFTTLTHVPAVQRLQRALRRAERVRRPVRQPLAVGGGRAVAAPARRRGLRAVPAAGVLDRGPGRGRLAGLRGGGELGAVAARAEQAGRLGPFCSGQGRRRRTEWPAASSGVAPRGWAHAS